MSYIGSTPTTQSFIAGTDSFNGTGSATNFTLSRSVNSTNDIQVVVNNVVQYPPNYSVSGNTLTISPAPSSGTNNVYVRYLSTTLQSITVPGGSTVVGGFNVTGTVTATTFAGALTSATGLPLTTGVTGTLPVANGGTGNTTAQAEMNRVAGAVTSGQYLRGNGTNVVMSAIQAGDVPTLNQNTTGSAGSVTGNATGSTFGFNSGYGSVATAYGCRAWVNFNGTGTVAIRASGNVSSITDNGTGDYTVNFTNAMPDGNYALTGAGGNDGEMFSYRGFTSFPPTTTAVRVAVTNAAGTRVDSTGVTLAIFR